MKTIIMLLFLTFSGVSFAQGNQDTSVFHRLIIYNAQNEIMLVKFKDTDLWVTPGFYQDSIQFIKAGLHTIAATYGLKISTPKLRGTFSLRRENGDSKKMLIRNIYHCNYLSGTIHFPENQTFEIDEIKWLPLKEALLKIPLESVKMFIEQTNKPSNVVWGGSISVRKKDDKWQYEIIEEFYPIFEPDSKGKN